MGAKNLGEILVEQGAITGEALTRALQIQNRRLGEILIQERLADPIVIANALKAQARAQGKKPGARLAVDSRLLDDLLRRLELVEDELAVAGLRAITSYSSVTGARQSVEALLVEPIDNIFEKASRAADMAARELKKRARVIVEGRGLVVDRRLVDELSDLVLHLVRNAVDHGLEEPKEREAAGKPAQAVITVSVRASRGKLELVVRDDGRGIDEEKVREIATGKGFLKGRPPESVSREELFKLLFTPGFSTAGEVSTLSGRGVGLDVVEAGAMRLGGEVSVESEWGKGSAFRVVVPLRYLRMNVVPVRAGDRWVAVASDKVGRVGTPDKTDGMCSGASLFGADVERDPAATVVEVEYSGGARWAFDEVKQSESVLVRDATALSQGVPGVLGGARLQDGSEVLLLDLGAFHTSVRTL
jgi:two-component system chemotaxis sensor kinase CheA